MVGAVGTVGTVRRSTASNSGTVVLVGAIGCVRVELSITYVIGYASNPLNIDDPSVAVG